MAKGKQLLFNLGEDTHHLSGDYIPLHIRSSRRHCERQCGMPEMALVLFPPCSQSVFSQLGEVLYLQAL